MKLKGELICLFVMAGMLNSHAAEKRRISVRDVRLESDTVIFNVDSKRLDAELEICLVIPSKPQSGKKCLSGLQISLESRDGKTSNLSMTQTIEDYSELYERRRIDLYSEDKLVKRLDGKVTDDINLTGGDNYLLLSLHQDGRLDVYLGADNYKYCTTVNVIEPDKIVITGSQGVELPFAVLSVATPTPLLEQVDLAGLSVADSDMSQSLCGVWSYLDRDNDPDYARLGGDYLIALMPAGDAGSYNIYYVSGSEVNNQMWQPGMLKGRLSALPLHNRFRLEWWDSEMNRVDGECHAALDDGILSLNFPLLHTSIRFCRDSEVTLDKVIKSR